jgi:hypothetical protein
MNTVPLMATGSSSPKRLFTESAPAASVMPLTALGVVATGVALPVVVPAMLPALLRPLSVAVPFTAGCAACSVTV